MAKPLTIVRKAAIFCHRWMGVAFCLLFGWWFLSGIFMMYWEYPGISAADRLERASALDAAKIRVSPSQAWAVAGNGQWPDRTTLEMFDGRPVYRFTLDRQSILVYADDGTRQGAFRDDQLLRIAAAWARQPATAARAEQIKQPDQWTIQIRRRLPLLKYSFGDGQQVYISKTTGEILQYTTTTKRLQAHLSAIPHWIYYTPLRVQQKLWTNVVIYASLLATIAALLGMVAGIWMYSPSRKYRFAGQPSSIPYTGQKRLHTILGLCFGVIACTWAFSGMLSMDPPFLANGGASVSDLASDIQDALGPIPFDLSACDAKSPPQALAQLGRTPVKQLELISFDGEPVYIAWSGPGETRIVPLRGEPKPEFDPNRIFNIAAQIASPAQVAAQHLLTRYDAYYLDRHRQLPLPVLFLRFNDADHTQVYIDQRTGRVVAQHSDRSSFLRRWLYHGLHSFDFPWLYSYRPAWDIVVLALMAGGLWLSVTSIILAWRVLQK